MSSMTTMTLICPEHFGKLKFALLELSTKRRFLVKLTDDRTQWDAIPIEYSPGAVKALDGECQAAKERLQTVKEEQARVGETIEKRCTDLTKRLDECGGKRMEALKLIGRIRALQVELREHPMANEVVNVVELKERLHQARIAKEKLAAALAVQRQAVADVTRLLAHHEDTCSRLQDDLQERECELGQRLKQRPRDSAITDLCQWWRGIASLTDLAVEGAVQAQVVRPDYLLVTVSNPRTAASVPIHIRIDKSGRLLTASIGSTANTPKAQWKELVEAAIKNNDIPYLIRQVHYRIIKSTLSH